MKITANELMALGLWEKYCKDTGTSVWAVNEGLLDPYEVLIWEPKQKGVHNELYTSNTTTR